LRSIQAYLDLLEKNLSEPLRIIINIHYHSSLPFVGSEASLFNGKWYAQKEWRKVGENGKKLGKEK
jgi:hypothetical protein